MFSSGGGLKGRRGEGGEWMRGFGLGFTNPVGIRRVLDLCLYLGCGGMAGVSREWVGDLEEWGGVMSV